MCMNMLKVWNHAVKPGTSEVFVRPGWKKDYNKSGLKENFFFFYSGMWSYVRREKSQLTENKIRLTDTEGQGQREHYSEVYRRVPT